MVAEAKFKAAGSYPAWSRRRAAASVGSFPWDVELAADVFGRGHLRLPRSEQPLARGFVLRAEALLLLGRQRGQALGIEVVGQVRELEGLLWRGGSRRAERRSSSACA